MDRRTGSLQGAWARYVRHVELRNRLVHAGYRATRKDAEESVDAVRDLMHDMIEQARAREQKLSDQPA